MKYKVGNIVRVRKDLELGKMYGKHDFIEEMEKYKGKQAIIECIFKGTYDLSIDNGDYRWTDEMLEPVDKTVQNTEKSTVESGQFTKEDFKFGDIIILRNDDKYIYLGEGRFESKDDIMNILWYNEDFKKNDNDFEDIIKVKRLKRTLGAFYEFETLYERKEEILDEK